jgi:hypothetical protein
MAKVAQLLLLFMMIDPEHEDVISASKMTAIL